MNYFASRAFIFSLSLATGIFIENSLPAYAQFGQGVLGWCTAMSGAPQLAIPAPMPHVKFSINRLMLRLIQGFLARIHQTIGISIIAIGPRMPKYVQMNIHCLIV